jgi:hypothetical protein
LAGSSVLGAHSSIFCTSWPSKEKDNFCIILYMLGWYTRTRVVPNLRPGPPFGNALVLKPYPPKHLHKGEKTTLCHNTKR